MGRKPIIPADPVEAVQTPGAVPIDVEAGDVLQGEAAEGEDLIEGRGRQAPDALGGVEGEALAAAEKAARRARIR